MDFSFITEALKKVEYIEGYKNPTLFSSELSPTSSIEECVSSPKSKMFSHGQRSPTDGSDSPPSECKIESFKKSASLRQLYDSEFNKRNDGFASPEKQRRRFQRELINNSVSPPDLIASSPSLYHPHKDYLYSRSCSLSPFKSYHNNNSICYSRRSFHPYPLEKQEYFDHHREDFSVGEHHKYMKQESPTFNYTMSSRTQLYNQSRLIDSINTQSPHQQNISSNNDHGDIKFVHDEKQRGSFRKHNSCCAVCGDKLSSYFHGAVVCVSCQGFFKRALKNNRKYTCLGHRNCSLNKKTRNHCQACRLATCFKVGIKRDGVLEEIRQEKERKIAQKSVKKNSKIEHLSSTSSIDLKSIYDAEKFAHPHIGNFAEIKSHIIHHLCRSIDKQLVSLAEWARRLPCFGDLNITDQVKVLQSTWSELLIGALCFRSLTSDGLMLETGLYVSRASIEDNSFEATLTRTFDKALERMKELQVDMTEWGCLRAVILFNPDVSGLGAVDQVEETRERYLSTLIGYCKLICPNESNRFSKLLLCLPRIKSLALEVIEILKYSQLIANSSIDSFICDILADI